MTTPLEVRFRPLLVGSSEATLKLDSTELGLYEWKLKLTGAPTVPEKPLAFSVPLGTREVQVRAFGSRQKACIARAAVRPWLYVLCIAAAQGLPSDDCRMLLQVLRFTHWLPEKAEYKCSFTSSSGSAGSATAGGVAASSTGFDAPASVVVAAPAAAGPNGTEVECTVGFEPCALGEAVRDTLVLTSATAGVYEVPLMGQCVPPKPQGPIDVSKVSMRTLRGGREVFARASH